MPINDSRLNPPSSLSQRQTPDAEYAAALMEKIRKAAKQAGVIVPPKPESEPL